MSNDFPKELPHYNPSSRPNLDATMAPGDSAGQSDGPSLHGSMASDTNLAPVGGQITGFCMALSDDRSHRHHLMPPQLLQSLRPRLARDSSPGPEMTLNSVASRTFTLACPLPPSPLQICFSPQSVNSSTLLSLSFTSPPCTRSPQWCQHLVETCSHQPRAREGARVPRALLIEFCSCQPRGMGGSRGCCCVAAQG